MKLGKDNSLPNLFYLPLARFSFVTRTAPVAPVLRATNHRKARRQ
jgi:hypothetical protein